MALCSYGPFEGHLNDRATLQHRVTRLEEPFSPIERGEELCSLQ